MKSDCFCPSNYLFRHGFITLIMLLMVLPTVSSQESGSVLVFVRHGKTTHLDVALRELDLIVETLEAAGYSAVTATIDGEGVSSDSYSFSPDRSLAEVDLLEFSGLVFPCFLRGETYTRWRATDEEESLARSAAELGLPIAAQHGASIILCEAGLLEGRSFNAWIDDRFFDYDCYAAGSYTGEGPVSDSGIITSGYCEYAVEHHGGESHTEELMRLFVTALTGTPSP